MLCVLGLSLGAPARQKGVGVGLLSHHAGGWGPASREGLWLPMLGWAGSVPPHSKESARPPPGKWGSWVCVGSSLSVPAELLLPLGPLGRGPLTGAPTSGHGQSTHPGLPPPGPCPRPRKQAPGPWTPSLLSPVPSPSPGSLKVPWPWGQPGPQALHAPHTLVAHQPPKHPSSLAVACAGGDVRCCPARPGRRRGPGGCGLTRWQPTGSEHSAVRPTDTATLSLSCPPSQRVAVGSPSRDVAPPGPHRSLAPVLFLKTSTLFP